MRSDDQKARAERSEAGVLFRHEINGGEEEALDLAGEEDRASRGGEGRRRKPIVGH